MQRWIAAGVVLIVLLMGGAYFGYKTLKRNRPSPIWVPIAINADLPITKRDEIIKSIKDHLSQASVLEKVSHDLGLPAKMGLPNDKSVSDELTKRLFVRAGDMDTPTGKVPSIHVGVTGKVKEAPISGEIAMRLMDDVWPLLGIKPPPKGKNP